MQKRNIFQDMEQDVNNATDIGEETKKILFSNILRLKDQKVNLMITGATGSGKSSTINALFDMQVAKVGVGVDPETMDIQKYELDNLILWDSPGLGDGKEKDNQHSKGIIKKLHEVDDNGKPLIDLVLVILDGSTRDLGTSYELINSVIIPAIGETAKDRVLIAINQADVAMKGRHWNYDENKPEPKLVEFLDEKANSVKRRILEATGVHIQPIYYSAGFTDDNEQQSPYNLSKLMYFIVKNTPSEKRLVIADKISDDENMWKNNDDLDRYNDKIKQSFIDSVVESAGAGADLGESIGSVFGSTGRAIGKVVGTVGGAIVGGIKSLFSW